MVTSRKVQVVIVTLIGATGGRQVIYACWWVRLTSTKMDCSTAHNHFSTGIQPRDDGNSNGKCRKAPHADCSNHLRTAV